MHENGFDAYGVDHSKPAIDVAREWAFQENFPDPIKRILQADVRVLPFESEFFQFAVSRGVLDSMSYDFARKGIVELARVLKQGGLFYCDLISGDDSLHAREYSGEEILEREHERGTIQLYFNMTLIRSLFEKYFEILECKLIRCEDVLNGGFHSRYHCCLKKI